MNKRVARLRLPVLVLIVGTTVLALGAAGKLKTSTDPRSMLPDDAADVREYEAFAETFTEDSLILLSPDCGSEEVRRRNKGFHFTNADLLASIELASKHSVRVAAYFSFGLPFETREDLEVTAELIGEVQARGAVCSTDPMFLDPFSPLFSSPERFGVTVGMKTLSDFVAEHRDAVRPRIGYRTEALSEEDILEGCRYLSDLAGEMPGDPEAGPAAGEQPSCSARFWRSGG